MLDGTKHQERLRRTSHLDEHAASLLKKEAEAEGVEASCGAFGYLRGIRDFGRRRGVSFPERQQYLVSLFLAGKDAARFSGGHRRRFGRHGAEGWCNAISAVC